MLDVSYEQTVPSEKVVEGRQREVAEVLMLDGIEFAPVHHLLDIGHFYYGDPVVF